MRVFLAGGGGVLGDGDRTGRAVSNAKARACGWTPAYPRWREGFRAI